MLLGRDGKALASGLGLPNADSLARALEAGGERNPVALLQAFLKERPDHDEARLDLARALRPRLLARLQNLPADKGRELSPEADVRVWGPMAQELDWLLQDGRWVGLNLNLDRGLLPEGVPERHSPLMKALYRRHRPSLLKEVQRFPEYPPAWFNLLRMDQALGEPGLLRALEGITWFQVRPVEAAMMPYGTLAQRIHAEAKRTGDWRGAMEVGQALWAHLVRPKLAFYGKACLLPPEASAAESEKWSVAERDTVWAQLLSPLVEALVRSGGESEVPALLGELDGSWIPLGLETRLVRLARSLERADLVPMWITAIQALPVQVPREGLLGHDRVLFHQGQGIEGPPPGFDKPFRMLGMTLGFEEVPASWVHRLGWKGQGPRWALLDAQGRTLLHGERLPTGGQLMVEYKARGLPVDLDRVVGFRQRNPEHLGALAIEVRLRGTIAWARHEERTEGPNPPGSMLGPEIEAWRTFFAVLEQLVRDPLGCRPGVMRAAQVRVPTPRELGECNQALEAESLARRILPRLESGLGRCPTDMDLWRLWFAFAPHWDRPLAPFLDSLAPSPMTLPGAWPPQEILAAAADGLKLQERWQDLADLLGPRWMVRRKEVEKLLRAKHPAAVLGYYQNWSWELSRPLLESLLRLGRTREADEMLEALAAAGGEPGPSELGSLCQLARELGMDSWGAKWRPKGFKEP
ncbi:hypothetical protein [Mesoterricola silvestris]|uniref:hypothetical protein n=1 Tax=Mesoterricola silvestris TaxID=2927979 RepID=UPI00292F54DB|nr:hypothetical protein [Mesoterricola silvestris]